MCVEAKCVSWAVHLPEGLDKRVQCCFFCCSSPEHADLVAVLDFGMSWACCVRYMLCAFVSDSSCKALCQRGLLFALFMG